MIRIIYQKSGKTHMNTFNGSYQKIGKTYINILVVNLKMVFTIKIVDKRWLTGLLMGISVLGVLSTMYTIYYSITNIVQYGYTY